MLQGAAGALQFHRQGERWGFLRAVTNPHDPVVQVRIAVDGEAGGDGQVQGAADVGVLYLMGCDETAVPEQRDQVALVHVVIGRYSGSQMVAGLQAYAMGGAGGQGGGQEFRSVEQAHGNSP